MYKRQGLLIKVQPSLEQLVNFGWTGVIAKPLLFALQWLHRYIPNWGWAIVALTLVINFAVFPLKMKSWRSMQDMQKIAPEMKQIQDKYKKYSMTDPRKKGMQDEMAELYQRHGINPMAQLGGCVPMLIQICLLYTSKQNQVTAVGSAGWSRRGTVGEVDDRLFLVVVEDVKILGRQIVDVVSLFVRDNNIHANHARFGAEDRRGGRS